MTLPPRKARRSQIVRKAETRARLIEATIQCLNTIGYSATSITVVAKQAGLSRAIIGYHFASKAELIVAVRDEIWKDLMQSIRASIAQLGVRATLERMPSVIFAAQRGAPAMVQLEITLAARGDADLRERLRVKERSIFDEVVAFQPDFFEQAGMDLPPNFATILNLTHATLNGLALNEAILGEELGAEACIAMFNRLMNREFGFQEE